MGEQRRAGYLTHQGWMRVGGTNLDSVQLRVVLLSCMAFTSISVEDVPPSDRSVDGLPTMGKDLPIPKDQKMKPPERDKIPKDPDQDLKVDVKDHDHKGKPIEFVTINDDGAKEMAEMDLNPKDGRVTPEEMKTWMKAKIYTEPDGSRVHQHQEIELDAKE